MKNSVLRLLEESMNSYLSGQEIARELNMSRANVWKEVKKLQEQGYEILSQTNRGYSLVSTNGILSEDRISRNFTKIKPQRIVVFETIDSTNNYVNTFAKSNPHIDTALVVSNSQTHGKGRMNRSFYSPGNSGIYMSILLRPVLKIDDVQLITICAALAVQHVIQEHLNIETKIKWLNDIYHKDLKVCGILTEGDIVLESLTYNHVTVGFGINLYKSTRIPDELKGIYGSLSNPDQIDRNLFIAKLYERFNILVESIPNHRELIIHEYKKHSIVLGKKVHISSNPELAYTAVDIDMKGQLIVVDDQKNQLSLNSGEVSILKESYEN